MTLWITSTLWVPEVDSTWGKFGSPTIQGWPGVSKNSHQSPESSHMGILIEFWKFPTGSHVEKGSSRVDKPSEDKEFLLPIYFIRQPSNLNIRRTYILDNFSVECTPSRFFSGDLTVQNKPKKVMRKQMTGKSLQWLLGGHMCERWWNQFSRIIGPNATKSQFSHAASHNPLEWRDGEKPNVSACF